MPAEVRTILRELELDLLVEQAEEVAHGVRALTMVRADGEDLPAWTPGAHIDVELGDGLVRQYSLCGDVGDKRAWRIAVLRAPFSRGGSAAVHDRLVGGAGVRVRGPRNHFPFLNAGGYHFLAGGIGITPLLPMIAQAQASGRQWRLTYVGRSRSTMAFVPELEEHGDRVRLLPKDEVGRADLAEVLGHPTPDTLVYACGPEPLTARLEELSSSWAPGTLHVERFTAAAVDASGDQAFEVELQRSGTTVQVPADMSVLEAVTEAGVSVLGSCYEGVCGTCETVVVGGEVDHRDSILTENERDANEFMMICVSRCKGQRLILDL